MRVGVGGRVGPVRGGISNRGVGVGAGPLSVGTSWRGSGRRRGVGSGGGDEEATALAVIVCVALAILVFGSIGLYFLGTWVAVEFFDVDNPSRARSLAGWIPEILWLALLLLFVVAAVLGKDLELSAQRIDASTARAHGHALGNPKKIARMTQDPVAVDIALAHHWMIKATPLRKQDDLRLLMTATGPTLECSRRGERYQPATVGPELLEASRRIWQATGGANRGVGTVMLRVFKGYEPFLQTYPR